MFDTGAALCCLIFSGIGLVVFWSWFDVGRVLCLVFVWFGFCRVFVSVWSSNGLGLALILS